MSDRRKQFYTDQKLQGYLLVALIALEVVLVALLIYFLHVEIRELLEDQIYQIHKKDHDTLPRVYQFLSFGLLGFLSVNIAALYVAHLIWGRYIKNTIKIFSQELDRMDEHDFSPVISDTKTHHHMIKLMDDWMMKEKKRKKKLNRVVHKLSELNDVIEDHEQNAQAKKLLDDYRSLLPQRQ